MLTILLLSVTMLIAVLPIVIMVRALIPNALNECAGSFCKVSFSRMSWRQLTLVSRLVEFDALHELVDDRFGVDASVQLFPALLLLHRPEEAGVRAALT
jgi:hypothetical protein